ncbi:type I-F CRISPR-associated protein Csy3 [Marinobacter sp. M3C]|jgi:CRISPR-associated protein Csy3|uniref:type I-F CRISPR-associated protein Csy3 n=1 Tax=unclassified Marinobacter TaxID=83889 RepID=UPI002010AA3C|nr:MULTISPECIES: type I-F CRISPR-associated protein Csy3 [unclassified Marinobacter]MCL1477491.1 type I-F CRISPR-associated protein Csy3 [Marinobacter sp.]MCL1486016.1 type I-F CRISPR-associated protein Csy3 [Marinobacter sp.]UQG57413.1 type I-F CRISPR-associated protein Csy3 [Marinobacter sp. M4C]UQG61409.1 type I-F CRISPR-associated protein Csy3 [Marinobacter sp. M3C]UQG66217.1 type I-F CRISPR-associated protein Csy3 [Marinobacter sp. M2C]
MSTEQQPILELPSSLSLKRNIVISDARMYSLIKGEYADHPVTVIRHGIRGTNNTLKGSDGKEEGSGEISTTVEPEDVRNLQEIDSAKLDPNSTGLVVEFSFALTNLVDAISGINPNKEQTKNPSYVEAFRESILGFMERATQSEGITEVCNRIARNVMNGRWLWRNRLIGEAITVTAVWKGKLIAEAEALALSLKDFSDFTEAEQAFGAILADQLRGKGSSPITVTAKIQTLGHGAIEVYPSQNYIPGARDDDNLPSRSLYVLNKAPFNQDVPKIIGEAAIRDQKLWNALRTIDTWYETGGGARPIAVEPMGANLTDLRFYRTKAKSAFKLLERLNELDPAAEDGMFMIAAFIRGGVYTTPKKTPKK